MPCLIGLSVWPGLTPAVGPESVLRHPVDCPQGIQLTRTHWNAELVYTESVWLPSVKIYQKYI